MDDFAILSAFPESRCIFFQLHPVCAWTNTCAFTLQGLALGFVLLRVEALAEAGDS